MTAFHKYERLEATGLWRPDPELQRREVVVSIGDATLVISDLNDRPLTHWSLAAVARSNPGKRPALYYPDGDPDETLELGENETEMVDAIEKLRRAIERGRPRPGRLRWLGVLLSVVAVLAVLVFWLPGAMRDNAVRVVPAVKRNAIGIDLLERLQRVSGQACREGEGQAVLDRLAARLGVKQVVVLPSLARPSLHLPGGILVLDRSVIEDYEDPDVAAGFILAEDVRSNNIDPLRALLEHAGLRENFRLLTTGEISAPALEKYAEYLLVRAMKDPRIDVLLARFEAAKLRSTPYAKARDITGETTLAWIEGDPMNGLQTQPLMPDSDWLRLQSICGG